MRLRQILNKSPVNAMHPMKHTSAISQSFFRSYSAYHLPNVQQSLARFTFPEQWENMKNGLMKIYEKEIPRIILDAIEKEIPHNLVIDKILTKTLFDYSFENERRIGYCEFSRFYGRGLIWISSNDAIEIEMQKSDLLFANIELSILSILIHEAECVSDFDTKFNVN